MATEQVKEKGKEEAKDKDKDKDKSKESAKDKKEGAAKEVDAPKEMSTKKLILLMSMAFVIILLVTVIILVICLRPSAKALDHASVTTTAQTESVGAGPQVSGYKNPTPIYQAQFVKIDPSFVVNFSKNQNIKFLEIAVTLVTKTDSEASQVKNNMPFIKDQLVTLFSAQKYDDIKTQQGKDLLRTQALTLVQSILEKEAGDKCVTDILFTSFVMQ